MTSSSGNIFRVTGPLCGEFTGPGEFPTQRPVTWSFDVFFDLRLNKRLTKQPWGWWFETTSWSLWRQCNGRIYFYMHFYVMTWIRAGTRFTWTNDVAVHRHVYMWRWPTTSWHIETETKLSAFCRWYFRTHFLVRKLLYFASNFLDICSQ